MCSCQSRRATGGTVLSVNVRHRPPFSPLALPPDGCTRYLFSTDSFRNGADESRRVRYVGFYDPGVTPRNNSTMHLPDRTRARDPREPCPTRGDRCGRSDSVECAAASRAQRRCPPE
jgi:hypothetical protein